MKYVHIGWCKEDSHDKVWGVICLQELVRENYQWKTPGKYVTFWGRRGKKLQTKIWDGSDWDAEEMFRKKTNKGYEEVDKNKLDEVYPEFQEDLEKTAVWALLSA